MLRAVLQLSQIGNGEFKCPRGVILSGLQIDLNQRGDMAFAVVDALRESSVPFAFAISYDQARIPSCYKNVTRCEQPVALP